MKKVMTLAFLVPVAFVPILFVPALRAEEVSIEALRKSSAQVGQIQHQLDWAYQQLSGKLRGPELRALEETQRLWMSYRERNCRLEAGRFKGRRIERAVFSDCVVRMTRARTAELSSQLDDRKTP